MSSVIKTVDMTVPPKAKQFEELEFGQWFKCLRTGLLFIVAKTWYEYDSARPHGIAMAIEHAGDSFITASNGCFPQGVLPVDVVATVTMTNEGVI